MQFRLRRRCSIIGASLALFAAPVLAQTTMSGVQARLLQKKFYLRGQWKQDKLKFNSAGNTSAAAGSAPFTLSGIYIDSVEFGGDGLVIQGDRMGLEFMAGLPFVSIHQRMEIDVAGTPGKDFGPALDKVFANNLADLAPSLPPAWQPFIRANFSRQGDPASDSDQPVAPAGQVIEPSVLSLVPGVSTAIASSLKYGGTVRVRFVVNPDGTTSNPRIVTALGLGLDEQAISAILQSRFKPATLDGKPIARELVLEVKFQNP
jgi:TonB family protein